VAVAAAEAVATREDLDRESVRAEATEGAEEELAAVEAVATREDLDRAEVQAEAIEGAGAAVAVAAAEAVATREDLDRAEVQAEATEGVGVAGAAEATAGSGAAEATTLEALASLSLSSLEGARWAMALWSVVWSEEHGLGSFQDYAGHSSLAVVANSVAGANLAEAEDGEAPGSLL
jgi:hypothetical protein